MHASYPSGTRTSFSFHLSRSLDLVPFRGSLTENRLVPRVPDSPDIVVSSTRCCTFRNTQLRRLFFADLSSPSVISSCSHNRHVFSTGCNIFTLIVSNLSAVRKKSLVSPTNRRKEIQSATTHRESAPQTRYKTYENWKISTDNARKRQSCSNHEIHCIDRSHRGHLVKRGQRSGLQSIVRGLRALSSAEFGSPRCAIEHRPGSVPTWTSAKQRRVQWSYRRSQWFRFRPTQRRLPRVFLLRRDEARSLSWRNGRTSSKAEVGASRSPRHGHVHGGWKNA